MNLACIICLKEGNNNVNIWKIHPLKPLFCKIMTALHPKQCCATYAHDIFATKNVINKLLYLSTNIYATFNAPQKIYTHRHLTTTNLFFLAQVDIVNRMIYFLLFFQRSTRDWVL